MNEIGIGQLIVTEQKRDAIHVPVVPVTADEHLKPGQHVRLISSDKVGVAGGVNALGVVDPFLRSQVLPGQRFWLFLYPGSITSLRHDWMHPAFRDGVVWDVGLDEKALSEKWLREQAEDKCIDYNTLISDALSGEVCFGTDATEVNNDEEWKAKFWRHIENVTGKHLSDEHRENTYFHCAC